MPPGAAPRSADGRRDTISVTSRREAVPRPRPCPPWCTWPRRSSAIVTPPSSRPHVARQRRRRPGAQAHGATVGREEADETLGHRSRRRHHCPGRSQVVPSRPSFPLSSPPLLQASSRRLCDGFFASTPSPRPWVAPRAQGDFHVPSASPIHLPRRRVARRVASSSSKSTSQGAMPPWRSATQRGWTAGHHIYHIPWRSGAAPRRLHPPEGPCRAAHRPSSRRRLSTLPWDATTAADLARRRMGAR